MYHVVVILHTVISNVLQRRLFWRTFDTDSTLDTIDARPLEHQQNIGVTSNVQSCRSVDIKLVASEGKYVSINQFLHILLLLSTHPLLMSCPGDLLSIFCT